MSGAEGITENQERAGIKSQRASTVLVKPKTVGNSESLEVIVA